MTEEFNWVLERSKCSIAMEFAELRRQAKKDAEFRDGQLDRISIQWLSREAKSFSIRRHTEGTGETLVTFFLEADHISVTDQAVSRTFTLRVGLNDDRECRFTIRS